MKHLRNGTKVLILLSLLVSSLGLFSLSAAAEPSIPEGATIVSATFSIYVTTSSGRTVSLYRVTAPWTETEVTWNNFASSYDSSASFGSFSSIGGWQSVDVTTLVRGWVDGTYPNYGFLIQEEIYKWSIYSSSDSGDSTLRPKLEICYTVGSSAVNCITIQRGQLGSVADAYIWDAAPAVNFGASGNLFTGKVLLPENPTASGDKPSLLRFDFTVTPCDGSIGNYVWKDLNGNGMQDADEPGVAGVIVELRNCEGVVLASTTTDSTGYYEFSNLLIGCYTVVVPDTNFNTGGPLYGYNQTYDYDGVLDNRAQYNLTCGETFLDLDFGYRAIYAAGTGTPGYWKNHPDAWPVDTIVIGGVSYSKQAAIDIMNSAGKSDKTYTMFNALVAAKLNVLIGNESSCIDDTIAAADAWMATYGPVGSGVKAGGKDSPWREGEPLSLTLDDYNNGRLCAAHRN